MEDLISLLQTTKDGNGILHCRFIYHNRLETTFQSGIFLNILTILIQSCSTDTVKLTSGKHRFQHIACIHCSVSLTFTLLYFFKDCFQTFLKLTSVFGTCHQSTHVQCKNLLILQTFRHIFCHDSLCKTLDCCCFTYTRLTDKHRIVLGLT